MYGALSVILKPEYPGQNRSVPWLGLWLLALSGHKQPWYWLCMINMYLPSNRTDFNYCAIQVLTNDIKCQYIVIFPEMNSEYLGLRLTCRLSSSEALEAGLNRQQQEIRSSSHGLGRNGRDMWYSGILFKAIQSTNGPCRPCGRCVNFYPYVTHYPWAFILTLFSFIKNNDLLFLAVLSNDR